MFLNVYFCQRWKSPRFCGHVNHFYSNIKVNFYLEKLCIRCSVLSIIVKKLKNTYIKYKKITYDF